jgi:aspartate aminotransferase
VIRPSPTLAVSNLASQPVEEGFDFIGAGAGEPDSDTRQRIKSDAILANINSHTTNTAIDVAYFFPC